MNRSDDLGTAKERAQRAPARGGNGHAGARRTPMTRWKEVTLASFDARAWRRQGMTAAKTRRVLNQAAEFFAERATAARAAMAAGPAAAGKRGKKGRGGVEASGAPPDCELITVEYRECVDESGEVHTCRCELYECPTGSYWQCEIVE